MKYSKSIVTRVTATAKSYAQVMLLNVTLSTMLTKRNSWLNRQSNLNCKISLVLTHSCPKNDSTQKLMFYCISIVRANIIRCCFSFNNIDGTFIQNLGWSLESHLGIGGYM